MLAPAAVVLACLVATPAPAELRTFYEPSLHGFRIDWCEAWARNCENGGGAHAFCRRMGFARARGFHVDFHVGRKGIVTLVLGDGRFCAHATCSGFRSVTCEGP